MWQLSVTKATGSAGLRQWDIHHWESIGTTYLLFDFEAPLRKSQEKRLDSLLIESETVHEMVECIRIVLFVALSGISWVSTLQCSTRSVFV